MVRAVSSAADVTMTRADGRRTKEEERPTHVGFGSAEVERSSAYHGDVREDGGSDPGEREADLVATSTVASRILYKMEVVNTMQRLGRKLECITGSVTASWPHTLPR